MEKWDPLKEQWKVRLVVALGGQTGRGSQSWIFKGGSDLETPERALVVLVALGSRSNHASISLLQTLGLTCICRAAIIQWTPAGVHRWWRKCESLLRLGLSQQSSWRWILCCESRFFISHVWRCNPQSYRNESHRIVIHLSLWLQMKCCNFGESECRNASRGRLSRQQCGSFEDSTAGAWRKSGFMWPCP